MDDDNKMAAEDYKAAIVKIGLSLNAAGPFLGAHPVTAHKWARTGPPPLVAKFLRGMLARKETAAEYDAVIADYLKKKAAAAKRRQRRSAGRTSR